MSNYRYKLRFLADSDDTDPEEFISTQAITLGDVVKPTKGVGLFHLVLSVVHDVDEELSTLVLTEPTTSLEGALSQSFEKYFQQNDDS